jgi:DNA-binding transcriptional MocR family regulator
VNGRQSSFSETGSTRVTERSPRGAGQLDHLHVDVVVGLVHPDRGEYPGLHGALRGLACSGSSRREHDCHRRARALASELGVSRRTALVAYEQLLAEGYVVGRVGSGTTVALGLAPSRSLPNQRAPERRAGRTLRLASFGRRLAISIQPFHWAPRGFALRYDFRYPLPAVDDFPWVQWRRLTARCLRQASIGFLSYGPPQGYEPLRVAIAQYRHRSRGFMCDPTHVIVVGGITAGSRPHRLSVGRSR